MHVDRARAEEQLLRDVAVGAADRDQPHDLELAPGQAGLLAHPPRHRAAELRDLGRGLGRQRAGAELARGAVGAAEALERGLAVAHRDQRHARAQLHLRALERDVEATVDLGRARELLGGGRGVAVEQRALADRARERGERVGVAARGGDPAQRLGAHVRAGAVAAAGEEARRPLQARDREVMVLGGVPALEQLAHVLGRFVVRALGGRDVGETRDRVDAHVVVPDWLRGRQRGDQHPPRRRQLALEAVDRAEQALRDPGGLAGVAHVAAELARPPPLAALAQHVDEAADARRLGARVAVDPAQPERGVERLLGAAIVG